MVYFVLKNLLFIIQIPRHTSANQFIGADLLGNPSLTTFLDLKDFLAFVHQLDVATPAWVIAIVAFRAAPMVLVDFQLIWIEKKGSVTSFISPYLISLIIKQVLFALLKLSFGFGLFRDLF